MNRSPIRLDVFICPMEMPRAWEGGTRIVARFGPERNALAQPDCRCEINDLQRPYELSARRCFRTRTFS